jgi:hypothetical protein
VIQLPSHSIGPQGTGHSIGHRSRLPDRCPPHLTKSHFNRTDYSVHRLPSATECLAFRQPTNRFGELQEAQYSKLKVLNLFSAVHHVQMYQPINATINAAGDRCIFSPTRCLCFSDSNAAMAVRFRRLLTHRSLLLGSPGITINHGRSTIS